MGHGPSKPSRQKDHSVVCRQRKLELGWLRWRRARGVKHLGWSGSQRGNWCVETKKIRVPGAECRLTAWLAYQQSAQLRAAIQKREHRPKVCLCGLPLPPVPVGLIRA